MYRNKESKLHTFILNAAVELAKEIGYQNITKKLLSKRIFRSTTVINYHFLTIKNLRNAVVQEAIDNNIEVILVQAIINRHPLIQQVNINFKRALVLHG